MSEISLKSPHFKNRDLESIKLKVKVTFGNAVTDSIDFPGLTLSSCAELITISGLETELGLSLDASREDEIGFSVLNIGTIVTVTEAEAGSAKAGSASAISAGTGIGDRNLIIDLTGGFAGASDSISDALVEIHIPVKPKDF